MIYAYVRVSSIDQNLERQLEAIKNYSPELKDENIFSDKQTGKDFNREEYQKLKLLLKKGDELIIKELDRLGRNKDGIKEELAWFKEMGIVVRILEVPSTLIDFQGQDWIADMVNNIIIEVLAAMAEQERIKIRTRQKEGIEAMPVKNGKRFSIKTGNYMGRPVRELSDFQKYLKKQKDGLITVTRACEKLNISRTHWYRLIKEVV